MREDMDDSRGVTTIDLHQLDSLETDKGSIPDTTDLDPLLETSEPRFRSQRYITPQEKLPIWKDYLPLITGPVWKRLTSRIVWVAGLIILGLLLIAISITRLIPRHEFEFPHISTVHWKGFDKIENYFAFGDSWTSIKYSTIGEQPNEQNPFGNPEWPGRPSSMGPNYVGYLTGLYNRSFVKTWDFAFPGSVVDTHNDPLFIDWLDFAHQLKDEFVKEHTLNDSGVLVPKGWTSDNTLFTVFFGINDVCIFDPENSHLDKTYASYESFVEQIYNASGRNFVLMNVPPLQYAPSIQHGPSKKRLSADSDVRQFNDMLARLIKDLRNRHDDITLFDFNLHDLFDRMIHNPAAFQQTAIYKDVTQECEQYSKHLEDMERPTMAQVEACGGLEVEEYLWRDGLHVTYPVHKLMAAAIAQMLESDGTSLL